MYFLLIRNVWREDVTMVDVSEHQLSPGGSFLTHVPSRKFMFLSPEVQPQINDRLLQLNQALSFDGSFTIVLYLHARTQRVFIVTTKVLDDEVIDGLSDVTSPGFRLIDTKL